jgi:hypothetical protein
MRDRPPSRRIGKPYECRGTRRHRPNRATPLCPDYKRAPEAASISYAVLHIFETNGPQCGLTVEIKMAHFPTDEKYRDLIYDDDYRSYLTAQRDAPLGYRFGRTQRKRVRVHARTALRRANGFFKTMIEAIANSKLRRMERELELRGIRFDRSGNDWVTRKFQRTERSR